MPKKTILTTICLLGCVVPGMPQRTDPAAKNTSHRFWTRAFPERRLLSVPSMPAVAGQQLPEVSNVKSAGVLGDGKTNDRAALNKLVNVTLESGGDVYLPPGDYLIEGDLKVPVGVNLIFARGARLKPGKGTRIVLAGPVTAPPAQIFVAGSATQGTVSFDTNTSITGVFPNWWGSNTAPGTTDMTAAFQAAIDTGRTVLVPEGVYGVTSMIVRTGSQRIVGSGTQVSTLKALRGGKVISISGARTHLSFFTIDGNNTADYGVYLDRGASRTTLENLEIYNVNGNPGEGIGNQGIQNYLTHIVGCEIESCKTGIHLIKGAQGSVIDRCKIFDNSIQGVYLGDGVSPLYDLSISHTEIEMGTGGGVAKYNVVVNKVLPLTLTNIYFEAAAHANSADVKVVGAGSVIKMDGIYATGNDIANDSVILNGGVNLTISNYSCNAYLHPIPVSSLKEPDRFVKFENVDFNGVKKVFEVYNGDVAVPRLLQHQVTIASGTSTPDVSAGNILVYPANGVSVSINNFMNGVQGQVITLVNLSANRVTVTKDHCVLSSGASAVLAQGSSIQFVYLGSTWYEIGRSIAAADRG